MARKSEHRKRLREVIDVVFSGNETDAAKVARIPQATLNRILTGKIKDPSYSTLQKLADAYGVTVAWLTGEAPHLGNLANPNWYYLLNRYYGASTASDTAWLKRARGRSPKAKKAIEMARSTTLTVENKPLVCNSWVFDTDLRGTTPRLDRLHMEAVRATFEALRRDQQFAVAILKARSDVTADRRLK